MTNLLSIEEQLRSEYGVVKGWIAAHVYASVGLALVLGFVVRWIFWELL